MKSFNIEIIETMSRVETVEAADIDAAIVRVMEAHQNGDLDLNTNNSDFNVDFLEFKEQRAVPSPKFLRDYAEQLEGLNANADHPDVIIAQYLRDQADAIGGPEGEEEA